MPAKKNKDAAPAPAATTTPAPAAAGEGEIKFRISEKLNGVFGEYSSLDVEIGVAIPKSPEAFEAEIDRFMPRMVAKVQKVMNDIATGSGFKAPWGAEEKKK